MKQPALKAFIIYNKGSKFTTKTAIIFVFLREIYFFFTYFYFKRSLKDPDDIK